MQKVLIIIEEFCRQKANDGMNISEVDAEGGGERGWEDVMLKCESFRAEED